MKELQDKHFRLIKTCPWCGKKEFRYMYKGNFGAQIYECKNCQFVFSDKILNNEGLDIYWKNYETEVHCIDKSKNAKRKEMYKIEANYINSFCDLEGADVLDIGCAGGEFLDEFYAMGANCEGVEIGEEAFNQVSKKYKVYKGELPKLLIEKKYDLIIFRGTIQYLINPKLYFQKAFNLLNNGGLLYITSSPNAGSICFNVFKENFVLPVGVTDYYAYRESLLTEYFEKLGGSLVGKNYLYVNTPYADIENDIKKVAKALELRERGKKIDFISPPFFDNMLTLVYEKGRKKHAK